MNIIKESMFNIISMSEYIFRSVRNVETTVPMMFS